MATNNASSRNWRNRDDNWNHQQRRELSVPRPVSNQHQEGGGLCIPWRMFEERVRTGPFGLARFPSQPHSPTQILIIEGSINGERVNPRLVQFIHDSPPRIRGEWQLGILPEPPESPGLTDAEFNSAMKKLRKQVYEPPQAKRKSWKTGLFSNRNSSSNYVQEINSVGNEEDKQCSICLESFVPKEQVLMTPCNHLFHKKCVVPWVKSHGRCPVCRHMFCERKERVQTPNYSNYREITGTRHEDDLALDLTTLVRAMEEAFMWMHLS